MRTLYSHSVQVAASYLSIGLLAIGTLSAGQATSPQVASSAGGWKRVGDAPAGNQIQNVPDQSLPPEGPYPDQPPQQGGNPNQPTYQQTAPPAGTPPSYGQQPAGQPNYNQVPYAPQQGYPPQAPQAPVPSQLTVPAGTFITVRVNQFLSSDHNQQGDAFSASLIQPLVVNGVVVAEPGQTIAGRVVESQKAGRVEGTARLRVQLTELTLVDGQQLPIQTQLISRKGDTSVGRDAAAIAGTTGLGAAVGGAAAWGTGAAIGAGAGAAVGILGVLITRGHPSVIAPEQALTFRIEAPLTIYTDRAPQAFRYVQPNEYDRPMYNQPAYSQPGPALYSGAPYPAPYAAAPYPYYGGYYGYPYYSPFYYGPSFSLFFGGRGYYGRPGFYGRSYYGRAGGYVRRR